MSPVLSEATIMMIKYSAFSLTLCDSWIKIYELDNTARVQDTKALLKNPTLCCIFFSVKTTALNYIIKNPLFGSKYWMAAKLVTTKNRLQGLSDSTINLNKRFLLNLTL